MTFTQSISFYIRKFDIIILNFILCIDHLADILLRHSYCSGWDVTMPDLSSSLSAMLEKETLFYVSSRSLVSTEFAWWIRRRRSTFIWRKGSVAGFTKLRLSFWHSRTRAYWGWSRELNSWLSSGYGCWWGILNWLLRCYIDDYASYSASGSAISPPYLLLLFMFYRSP